MFFFHHVGSVRIGNRVLPRNLVRDIDSRDQLDITRGYIKNGITDLAALRLLDWKG